MTNPVEKAPSLASFPDRGSVDEFVLIMAYDRDCLARRGNVVARAGFKPLPFNTQGPCPRPASQIRLLAADIDWTPCMRSHLLIAAGSKRTQEPTRNDGIAPRLARLRIVIRETRNIFASSSAVKAWWIPLRRDARDFNWYELP